MDTNVKKGDQICDVMCNNKRQKNERKMPLQAYQKQRNTKYMQCSNKRLKHYTVHCN